MTSITRRNHDRCVDLTKCDDLLSQHYSLETDGPYLYTDGLSDELPFFAQARPRRTTHLQYKSGHLQRTSCKPMLNFDRPRD